MDNKEIGNFGENVAYNYLIKNQYSIIKRNYRIGFDEIDIIAKESDGTLVFIEVKTAKNRDRSISGFMPEDQMTGFKLKKIARACQKFSVQYPNLIDEEKGWRIDLIAITLEGQATGILHHYKNI
jgi:putative endonuclease